MKVLTIILAFFFEISFIFFFYSREIKYTKNNIIGNNDSVR